MAPAGVLAFPRTGQVAVVFGPGVEAAETVANVARAGGSIVRMGFSPGIVIASASDDPERFVQRLYQAGAWLVLDPIVMGGCRPPGVSSLVDERS